MCAERFGGGGGGCGGGGGAEVGGVRYAAGGCSGMLAWAVTAAVLDHHHVHQACLLGGCQLLPESSEACGYPAELSGSSW